MTSHVRGSKRLKIIQNYLNGREDDDYEVFPTKTEGKYIVRPRKTSITKQQTESKEKQIEEPVIEPSKEEPCKTVEDNNKIDNNKPKQKSTPQPFYDPTINMEILNQLKLLGEEMKNNREKKERKRMIKEVVNKQMMKRPYYNYTQPQYIQEPNDKPLESVSNSLGHEDNSVQACDTDNDEQPSISQPISRPLRRRINIFSDLY